MPALFLPLVELSLFLALLPAIAAFAVLSRVPQAYRKQEPWTAFLLIIPLFSVFWAFAVHPKVADSLRAWAASAGETRRGSCGKPLAVGYCVCSIMVLVPILGWIVALFGLVLLAIFYVRAFSISSNIGPSIVLPPPPLPQIRAVLPQPPPDRQQPLPPGVASGPEIEAQLRKLKSWREQGLISETEYQRMKQGWLEKLQSGGPPQSS